MPSRLTARLEKLLLALLLARLTVYCIGAFLPLVAPDIWRQALCLGVSLRYWSRWTLEPAARHLLLPAILDSGDAQGIMPMELPILYMVTAPFFKLGPYLGRALSIVFCDLVAFALVWANVRAWRGRKILGIEASFAMLLLPIFSVAVTWSGKYMPDFISIVLTCLAVGLSWDEDRPRSSFWLAALGLLLKPTSIIVLLLFAVNERLARKLRTTPLWLLPAVAVAGLYYTLGMRYLASLQDLPTAVGVSARSPLEGAAQFFRHLPFVLDFYLGAAFFSGGILAVLGITLWNRYRHGERFPWPLWVLSLGQFFALAVLDGGILFYDHRYYLMVLAPALCVLFVDALARCRSRVLYWGLLLGIVLPLLENSLRELKPLYRRPTLPVWTIDRQVAELKARNPGIPWGKGVPFRSSPEPYPNLGLYFGEIPGSTRAHHGFFYTDQPLPAGCAAIDRAELFTLGDCASN